VRAVGFVAMAMARAVGFVAMAILLPVGRGMGYRAVGLVVLAARRWT
jgi:hypothetical protein